MFENLTNIQMILFGGMAIVIVLLLVAVILFLRKEKDVPDKLPLLTEEPEDYSSSSMKKVLDRNIAVNMLKKAEIERSVKMMEKEYETIKSELNKLEKLRCQL